MSTFTGILLDVSGSMKESMGEGIDVEEETWVQSLFDVIYNLAEHDVSEQSCVFSLGFGARNRPEIFDIIGTIQDLESSNPSRASYSVISEIFSILQTHGARNIFKWATIDMVTYSISNQKALTILRRLKSDGGFAKEFVEKCLPDACKDVEGFGLGYLQDLSTSFVTNFKQASYADIEKVVENATKLISTPRKVSASSIFSVKEAAKIIRGYNDDRKLTKQRARELQKAVEPYIYGGTPLYSALRTATSLLSNSSKQDHDRLLFVLSDGMPTDEGNLNVFKETLRKANVTVIGCYISRSSKVEPRTLHSVERANWEEGARFLFKLSSTIATQLVTRAIFIKQGWNIDLTNNETKLFMHINHPDHLRDACSLARNVVCSQDALTDMLASVSLDIYINQKNTRFEAKRQVGGTCYANSVASVLHLAMHRISGRTGGYPNFEKIRDDLIDRYGFKGANTLQVLKEVCPKYRLHYQEVNFSNAMKAIEGKRPVIALFWLSEKEWEQFSSFYEENATGILRTNDLDVRRRGSNVSTEDGGHAVVLTSYDSKSLHLMNSWGEEWGDNGFFRVENAEILGLQFIDVYWTVNDLFPEELEYYRVHGSEVAEKLMLSLKGLQVAEYECPLCRGKSKVTSFGGSWSRAICPRCNGEFSCKDGQGNILALNLYLTSLSR